MPALPANYTYQAGVPSPQKRKIAVVFALDVRFHPGFSHVLSRMKNSNTNQTEEWTPQIVRVPGKLRSRDRKSIPNTGCVGIFLIMPFVHGLAAAIFVGIAIFSTCSAADLAGDFSSSALRDLVGTWTVEQGESMSRSGGRYSRSFEFLPDGTVFETTSYPTSGGGTSTQRRKRGWTAQPDKVVVADLGGAGTCGSNTVEIAVPFDKNRMALVETYNSQDSTHTTTMFATMTAPPATPGGVPPSGSQVPDAAARPTQPPSTKILLSVTPSVKNSTEGYYKIQKLSLTITLKNTDLKVPSGPLAVNFWILGKQGQGGKQFCLLKSGNFSTTLGTDFSNRETKTATEPTVNKLYNPAFVISSSGYAEYEGWIVAVKNSAGQLVAVKASKPDWERQLEKAAVLERGAVYDLKLNKLEGVRSYYYD